MFRWEGWKERTNGTIHCEEVKFVGGQGKARFWGGKETGWGIRVDVDERGVGKGKRVTVEGKGE